MAKSYGGVAALREGRITLREGEIHALVGENGAGKSTFVKVLCGITPSDAGEVTLDGARLSLANPREATAHGIGFVAQELSLFPDLSVRDNLFPLSPERRLGLVDRKALDRRAAPVLERLGLGVDPAGAVGDLDLADRQLLEIGRAMLSDPRVLVLDEPTSAQGRDSVERLVGVLRGLADDGMALLYISHFLEEVLSLADRVTVLRDGRTVLDDVARPEVDLDRLVVAMIGEQPTGEAARPAPAEMREADDRRLRLVDVEVPGRLHGVSLEVAPGEIVGVAGLQGAGHVDVLRAVCGQVRPSAGRVRLPGGRQPRSLRDALCHGVGLVPSDRKGVGLMLDRSAWENVAAARWLGIGRGGPWLRRSAERARAVEVLGSLGFRGDLDAPTQELSGGNQQKVVFAKWLETDPAVMVLDDPTRGVDIGARAEMHDVIRRLAARGRAVLLASSDLAELCELCDRVAVLQRGRIVAELGGADLEQLGLSRAMNAGFVAGVVS
ncbi:sugar ABC transporter ATP-binding protein [Nocardioides mangrovicus]|uniref:sugar ABC transporter ATP-binding protein n=1 Tax=Nocardioides mangrovicus TaxID=2478913 RepID=UPI0018E0B0D2|nr:sugar ABC transporter ATP-binding protein [Nocardioides mangrovicus]